MELPYSDLQIFYKGVPQFDNGLLRTPALSRGPFVYHLSIQVSPPSLPKSNLQYLKKLQQQGTKAELKGKKKIFTVNAYAKRRNRVFPSVSVYILD